MGNATHSDKENEVLGFGSGKIVQEFCWDEDVNEELREQIQTAIGSELEDEDFNEIADGIIVWWRESDGTVDDLSDLLIECLTNLDDGGTIWVFTPKPGRPDGVAAADIEEAAKMAGLPTTTSVIKGQWSGLCVEVHARR